MSWHYLLEGLTLGVCLLNLLLDYRKHGQTQAMPKPMHGPIR